VLDGDTRGLVTATAISFGAVALLAVAETGDYAPRIVAPLAMLIALACVSFAFVSYQRLLSWPSLIGLIVFVILFIPIKRYSLPSSLPFQLEPYRVIVFLVCVAWGASLLIDRSVRVRRSVLDGPMLVYVIAIVLSLLANLNRVGGLSQDVTKSLIFFSSFLLVYYLLVSVLRRARDVDFVVRCLTVGGLVLAISGIFEARTGYNLFSHLSRVMPFLKYNPGEDVLLRGGHFRAVGSAQHPIAFGAALVMLIPLAVYRAQLTRRRFWWLAAFVFVLAALATGSRTAVTMLLMMTVVYFVFQRRQLKRMWPALLPALIVIHVAAPGTLGTAVYSFFPSGGIVAQQQDAAVGSARLTTLGPVLHNEVAPDPVFGEGFATRITTPSPTTPIPNAPITDDQWLGSLAETGIVGAGALLWLLIRFFRKCQRAAASDPSPRRFLLAAAAAAVSSYGIGMLTYDAFSFIQVTIIFFVVLALGAAALKIPPAEWQQLVAR